MNKPLLLWVITLILSACKGWEYSIPTPQPQVPTFTPIIHSPTPRLITPTGTNTAVLTPDISLTASKTPTASSSPFPTAAETYTASATSPSPQSGLVTMNVIGCNTSIDITHGMGEVTNAYVTVMNTTGDDMIDLCTTLNAFDEGRTHPDKTVCVPILKNAHQVTLKLTVDSTYKEDTPIQIEVTSSGELKSRVGEPSCTDIGLFTPRLELLLTPVAIQ